jgi:hypothetical protein
MSENSMTEPSKSTAPTPPGDDDNEALLDAEKTFKITVIGALLFCLSALLIIMATRMG